MGVTVFGFGSRGGPYAHQAECGEVVDGVIKFYDVRFCECLQFLAHGFQDHVQASRPAMPVFGRGLKDHEMLFDWRLTM